MKEETVLTIAMKNTFDFLDEQSGLPKDFFENVVVVPLHCALDIIKDMSDTIEILIKTNEKLRHEKETNKD